MIPYKAEAILLQVLDWGSADRLITFFSREHGKITALARGARRPRSPLVGSLQVFAHVRLLLYAGRNHIDIINQCEVLHPFRHIREDLDKMAYGACMVELVAELLPERQPDGRVFQLLFDTLSILGDHNPRLVYLSFALKLFALTGFRPELRNCVKCGASITIPAYFSPAAGGMECTTCRDGRLDYPVSRLTYDCLLKLAALDMARPGTFSLPAPAVRDSEEIIAAYARCIVDRPLKALAFLQTLQHNGKAGSK